MSQPQSDMDKQIITLFDEIDIFITMRIAREEREDLRELVDKVKKALRAEPTRSDDTEKQIDELVDRFAAAVKKELKHARATYFQTVDEMIWDLNNPSGLIGSAQDYNLPMCGARAALLFEWAERHKGLSHEDGPMQSATTEDKTDTARCVPTRDKTEMMPNDANAE